MQPGERESNFFNIKEKKTSGFLTENILGTGRQCLAFDATIPYLRLMVSQLRFYPNYESPLASHKI